MKGYFDSFYPTWDTMPIEMGALAINIDYFRQVKVPSIVYM